MRLRARDVLLPAAAASAAVVAAWMARLPGAEWVWTGEKGKPFPEPLFTWWTLSLPGGIGAALIVAATALTAWRALRTGDRQRAASAVMAGALLLVFLLVAVRGLGRAGLPRYAAGSAGGRPSFSRLHQPFTESQWRDLQRDRRSRAPAIPYDPTLLGRGTFVGLGPEDVAALLGADPRQFGTRSRFEMFERGGEDRRDGWMGVLTLSYDRWHLVQRESLELSMRERWLRDRWSVIE